MCPKAFRENVSKAQKLRINNSASRIITRSPDIIHTATFWSFYWIIDIIISVLYNKQHPNSNIIMLCFLGKHVALHRIRYSKVIFPPISCYSLLLLHFVTALYYNLGYHTTLNLYDYYNAQYHIHSTMIHKIHISNLL